jgi:hypothetical protein
MKKFQLSLSAPFMIEAANSNGLGIKRAVVQDFLNSVPSKVTITSLLVILKSKDCFATLYYALK